MELPSFMDGVFSPQAIIGNMYSEDLFKIINDAFFSWDSWVGASLGLIAIRLAKKTFFIEKQMKARKARGMTAGRNMDTRAALQAAKLIVKKINVNARKTMDSCAAAVSNMVFGTAFIPAEAYRSWNVLIDFAMEGIHGFLVGLLISSVIHSERMARWARK